MDLPNRFRVIGRFLRILLEPGMPLWAYGFVTALIALAGSALLVGAAYIFSQIAEVSWPGPPPAPSEGTWRVLLVVVIAPITESILLGLTIWILQQKLKRPEFIAALAAIIWGLLHGVQAWPWFFGTVWSFFVYSCGYLAWQSKSRYFAIAAAAVPHALVNLVAGLFF